MNRFTKTLLHLAALLLFIGVTANTASAQPFYAAPNGVGVGCTDPTDPCDLPDAVTAANLNAGTDTIFLRINNNGAPSTFDLDGTQVDILEDVIFDIYVNNGSPAPPTGQEGTGIIEGDVAVAAGVTVEITENTTIELIGQPGNLYMEDGAAFDGDGWLAFTNTNGTHAIFLGDPTMDCSDAPAANGVFFRNVLIDMPGGDVNVVDECTTDANFSMVTLENRLDIVAGNLSLDDNEFIVTAEDDQTPAAGISIQSGGSSIEGTGTFFISIEPAASGTGFANNTTDCFTITGDGFLNMAFEKDTDGGVCIDLSEIGAGGNSENNAGSLFVREATQLNGSFENIGNARTAFWALEVITDDLTVEGPGDETDPTGSGFTNGICDGNESGVYFFAGVTIGGALELDDSDDPGTIDCVEGVNFEADLLAASGVSVVEGTFTADGETGVYLEADAGVYHNVQFNGDLSFGESPTFELDVPANAFVSSTLCEAYTVESVGNKVIFGGGDSQEILFSDINGLDINSVAVIKDSPGDDVEIDENSGGVFTIDTTLELINGDFVTNGLLDANSTTDPNGGATIIVNRTASEVGKLEEGTSGNSAYADANTLNSGPENLPRKVAYYGNQPRFTADEIPGDASGSLANDEVTLDELEIYLDPAANPVPIITISKDFTITNRLRLTQGNLQVGSSDLTLANEVQIAIGNANIIAPQAGGGNLIFPTIADNATNNNGIDLSYFGTISPRPVSLEWPTDQPNVIRNVEIARECGTTQLEVVLEDGMTYRVNPDDASDDAATLNAEAGLHIYDGGTLQLAGATLEVNAANGQDNEVFVYNGADLRDSESDALDGIAPGFGASARVAFAEELDAFRHAMRTAGDASLRPSMELYNALEEMLANQAASKAQDDHIGLLKFIGGADTDVWVETSAGRLTFYFPPIEVDKGNTGHVSFDGEGIIATTTGDVNANRLDRLSTYQFTLTDAALGTDGNDNTAPDAGGVQLLDGLDILEIRHDYTQLDGEFEMAGLSSPAPAPFNSAFQLVEVGALGGDFIEDDGEFFTEGGDVTVFGNFYQGDNLGADPGDALFSLSFNGIHTIVGDFIVGPDTDPCTNETAAATGDECEGAATPRDDEERNRYFQGGTPGEVEDLGGTILFGDFTFLGTGDVFNDDSFLLTEQGLRGNTIFVGATQQNVVQRQDEDAFLNDVVMSSTGLDAGILLQQDTFQNDTGTLTLEFGIIDTDDETWEWIILNPGFEPDLAGRNNSARGTGVVNLGSRDSYINGPVSRVVEFGAATGGTVPAGYLFPVGTQGDERTDGTGDREVDFFRPLLLQFPDDLGRASVARVDYLQEDQLPQALELPEDGLIVDHATFSGSGVPTAASLLLDTVADGFFWKLEFDRIPSWDPNLRLELQGLANLFDITSLRIIQWDCDGTNPRLAGVYDLESDPTIDDGSFVLNDVIDGVPNVTQEGVNVEACQILGIATNGGINPINAPNGARFAGVQYINVSGATATFGDVTLDDKEATPFRATLAGTDIGGGVTAAAEGSYIVIETTNGTLVKTNARRTANSSDAEFYFVHAQEDAPTVDLVTLDPFNDNTINGLWENNRAFGYVGNYRNVDAETYNIALTTADGLTIVDVYRFDFGALGGEAFTFMAACDMLLGVDADGNFIFGDLVTSNEEGVDLPTEFALDGNYPNPFNPSTTIQFALPETAEVTVEVIDVLGRQVMTIPAQMMEAGAQRSVQVNAASLASGTYIYRVIAQTATDKMVKTGRMTLVK